MRVRVPIRLRIQSVARHVKLYHVSLVIAGTSALLGAWHYTSIFLVGVAILFFIDRVIRRTKLSQNGFLAYVLGPSMPPEIYEQLRTVTLLESEEGAGERDAVSIAYSLPIDVGLEHVGSLFREVATSQGWTAMKEDAGLLIDNQHVPTLAWATMVSTDRPEVDVVMLHECAFGWDPEEDGEDRHDDRHVHLTYNADDLSSEVAALTFALKYALDGVE